jgi:hypothetical protein
MYVHVALCVCVGVCVCFSKFEGNGAIFMKYGSNTVLLALKATSHLYC